MVKNEPTPIRKSFLSSPEMAEAKKLMARFKTAMDDLDKKIDEFQKKTGYSPKEVRALFDNPNNFTPNQWEAIKEGKEKFFEALSAFEGSLDPGKKKMIEEIKNPPEKKRGTKTRGIRQKWIPMR